MQFKDLSDETLQRLGDRIIRNASARIRRQVPQRGKNPYATGKLARSLSFGWSKGADGTWGLTVDYLDYGKYTNFGTREYNAYSSDRGQNNFFGMQDFAGYRKGKKGIRPQWWLSLRGDKPVYEAIVEAELRMTWQTFLNNTISNLGNARQ